MAVALYVMAAVWALSAVLTVSVVGKPRKPLTGDIAAGVVVLNAVGVTVLLLAAGRLS